MGVGANGYFSKSNIFIQSLKPGLPRMLNDILRDAFLNLFGKLVLSTLYIVVV